MAPHLDIRFPRSGYFYVETAGAEYLLSPGHKLLRCRGTVVARLATPQALEPGTSHCRYGARVLGRGVSLHPPNHCSSCNFLTSTSSPGPTILSLPCPDHPELPPSTPAVCGIDWFRLCCVKTFLTSCGSDPSSDSRRAASRFSPSSSFLPSLLV